MDNEKGFDRLTSSLPLNLKGIFLIPKKLDLSQ